jgi:hypothetical protein
LLPPDRGGDVRLRSTRSPDASTRDECGIDQAQVQPMIKSRSQRCQPMLFLALCNKRSAGAVHQAIVSASATIITGQFKRQTRALTRNPTDREIPSTDYKSTTPCRDRQRRLQVRTDLLGRPDRSVEDHRGGRAGRIGLGTGTTPARLHCSLSDVPPQSSTPRSTLRNGPTNPWSNLIPELHQNRRFIHLS